tara:strand:- start:418 stop:1530 length:1113 start_codon:yes stop_codon:yes gene_type:complete
MEKKITDILAEWFYRLPNGYAIEPYDDSELKVLEQILKEEGIDSNAILKSIINEAPSGDQFIPGKDDLKTDTTTQSAETDDVGPSAEYNDAIKQRLNVQVIPRCQGSYKMKGGSFDLPVHPEDIQLFEALWPEHADSAIIGKGEIAMYWLFNYQKTQVLTEDGRGGDAPDLKIGGIPVEVKSYKSHNMITGLGRWSEFKEERRIVQNIFGIHALSKAFKDGDVANPITEITFKKAELETASQSLFNFLNLQGLDQLIEIFGSDSMFANMISNAESVFPEMKNSLTKSNVQVPQLTKGDDPTEVAVQVLQMLAAKKYGQKPGNLGYIANVIPGKADIHFHHIDIASITPEVTDSLNVTGGSIKGNLGKIFG